MQYKFKDLLKPLSVRGLALLAFALFLAGCAHLDETTPISPSPVGQRPTDFGLGSGVRPVSSGPGDKSSPTWSPSGDRIAFVVDGYAAEKRADEPEAHRQTTKDFGAREVAWMSSGRLSILAGGSPVSVYSTALDESLDVNKLASGATSMTPAPGGDGLLVALQSETDKSRLALVRPDGKIEPYEDTVDGEITAVSLVPGGDQAIISVEKPGAKPSFEILSFSFSEGRFRKRASLRTGLRLLGAPQWADDGIYYVAGEESESSKEVSPDYNLYQLPPGSDRPEPAPGVGEDFVASGIKRNPNGDLLAILGRRNPSSPVNLYFLRPGVGDLVAATANENMEIKTETEDLAWSDGGDHVAIVARTMLSEPRVYDVPSDTLVSDFYNIYEIPVEKTTGEGAA